MTAASEIETVILVSELTSGALANCDLTQESVVGVNNPVPSDAVACK